MWDQLSGYAYSNLKRRIIPTYVGSTDLLPQLHRVPANHSHVCGINCLGCIISVLFQRIIPTYVGSTLSTTLESNGIPNHSHVCGINSASLQSLQRTTESFPRMWDQQHEGGAPDEQERIIPTYVGSTIKNTTVRCSSANHSHVCGINDTGHGIDAEGIESFPRMWDQPLSPTQER